MGVMRCSGAGLRKLNVAICVVLGVFWAFCVDLGVWADAVNLDIWADTDLPDLTTTTTTTGSMQLILNFRQIMNVTWNILTLRNAYLK